jgi:hypothetical protein
MRHLVLLALVALVAVPLSAHGRWHGPRRVVEVEDFCRHPHDRWEGRRFDGDRWERRSTYRHDERRFDRRYDRRESCDDDRIVFGPLPRPLVPPFLGRVELRLR